MGLMKKLRQAMFGRSRDHQALFKKGSRPAIIIEALCEGLDQSGSTACKMLHTHNGDRDLREVRRRLRNCGVRLGTYYARAENGRDYKVTYIPADQRDLALSLIVGRA
jgi:hypothetical protein